LLEKLKQHIDTNFSFLRDKKLLIAISGGLDSVVLTHLFKQLEFSISLAHCNFNLRGKESDTDELFVEKLGKNLELSTYIIGFDTNSYATKNKLSTQLAARELRYNWFHKLVEEHQFDYVLTAHHTDDNLETFIINLSRGTGLEGLTGIPAINKNVVRPLLIFSRTEIEQFAKDNAIEWREDQSNASTKYIRNKIRHQILPVLKEINPSLLDSFKKTTENLQESQQIINDAVESAKKKIVCTDDNGIFKFDISEIIKLSNPKAYLFELLKSSGFTEWNDVENLLTAQPGKLVFSKTHRLLKDRDFLFLTEIKSDNDTSEYLIQEGDTEITLPFPLKLQVTSEISVLDSTTVYLDLDKISFPLTIRRWKKGDYFYPIGMQGKKKLSKFFKDQKYSIIDKENAWLLCSENQIVWIVKKRQDKRFIADVISSNILKLHITH
jgi:tRNA(Ile)-lysidine synthase